jgi:hypothetical protein
MATILCDYVYQWRAAGRWYSPGTPVSSTNKTDFHDIAEILLNVPLNTITLTIKEVFFISYTRHCALSVPDPYMCPGFQVEQYHGGLL